MSEGDAIIMKVATYVVRMDDGDPEEITIRFRFNPDPLDVITAWASKHGYKPHDCVTGGVIPRDAFSWNYQPKTGGFLSARENHICTAKRTEIRKE